MKYISTRGNAPELSFKEVALTGIATDGGLYVPKNVPAFTEEEILSWSGLSYNEIAFNVMYPFVNGEINENDFRDIIKESYASFRDKEVTPLHKLKDKEYVMELFHGPTLAFKDVALQFLGNLLDYILDEKKEDIVIIGATSGDTGSAAIEGCRHCKHIKMFMLHPKGKVSDVQRKQMTTILSDNIFNIAIEGNFDDCQTMVKRMFASPDFVNGKSISAVNSINWSRIMAQITYYFYAYLRIKEQNADKVMPKISFSVPTGNFGDVFAGYMAKKMGLPINKLIVATNKNDILHRFFQDNDYSQKGVYATVSPSMDIQISSNFERLLFDLYGQDGNKIKSLMDDFNDNKSLKVSSEVLDKAKEIFESSAIDDDGIKNIIKNTYDNNEYLVDPHTATGIYASENISAEGITVTLATADPAKFPDVIKESTGVFPDLPTHLHDLHDRKEYMNDLPLDIIEIKNFINKNTL